MAYRIDYGSVKFKDKKPKKKGRALAVGLILLLVVSWHALGLGRRFGKWLLPGDREKTAAALSDMVEQVENGEGMADAFSAFCKEIIEGASLPE